jgi:hypothetical protein
VTWRAECACILPHDIPYFVDRRQLETRRTVGLSSLRVMRYWEQLEWEALWQIWIYYGIMKKMVNFLSE